MSVDERSVSVDDSMAGLVLVRTRELFHSLLTPLWIGSIAFCLLELDRLWMLSYSG